MNPYQLAKRTEKAAKIAAKLWSLGINAGTANIAGLDGETIDQVYAEICFRSAAAVACGYTHASRETWVIVVELLQKMEEQKS